MTNNLQVWHEKVIKSRFITSCLRTDLPRIDKLYGRLTRCSFELYKLRKEVDVEYISVSGVVTCKDEKTRQDFTEKEKDIELEIATLQPTLKINKIAADHSFTGVYLIFQRGNVPAMRLRGALQSPKVTETKIIYDAMKKRSEAYAPLCSELKLHIKEIK